MRVLQKAHFDAKEFQNPRGVFKRLTENMHYEENCMDFNGFYLATE